MDLAVAGQIRPDEIDDFVDSWHAAPDGELHFFLGMDWDEYALWATEPDTIDQIVQARRTKRTTQPLSTL